LEPYLAEFVEKRVAGTVAEKKLKIMVGPALESLMELKQERKKFDLVFIDADKENYLNYYKVNSTKYDLSFIGYIRTH